MAREYPVYPIPSCHALIRRGDQILLIQRGRPPFEGYWGLPGGGVELGERLTEALLREVQEETGLEAEVHHYLGYADAIQWDRTGRVQWHYVVSYFEVRVIAGELQPSDDAIAAKWVTPSEARAMQTTDAVERCLAWSGL